MDHSLRKFTVQIAEGQANRCFTGQCDESHGREVIVAIQMCLINPGWELETFRKR